MPSRSLATLVAALLLIAGTAWAQPAVDSQDADTAAAGLAARTPSGRESSVDCAEATPNVGRALVARADGRPDDSFPVKLRALRLAERAARCAQDDRLLGAVLNRLSDTLLAVSQFGDAVAVGEESVAVHTRLEDDAGVAEAWNRVANADSWRGNVQPALDAYARALAISTALGDRVGQGRAWNNMALVYKNRGDVALALEYLQRALAAFDEVGDSARAAVVLNAISINYGIRGQYALALEYSQRGLALNLAAGNTPRLAASYDSQANAYRGLGAYRQALESFKAALALRARLGDPAAEMETVHNIGLVYYSQGDYEQALASYRRALQINRTVKDDRFVTEVLRNIGDAAWQLGLGARAEANFRESLAVARRIGQKAVEAELLNDLGETARARGVLATASRLFSDALALRRSIPDQAGVTESLTSLATVRLAEGRAAEALDLATDAAANAASNNQPELRWRALTAQGASYRVLGHPDEARRTLQDAVHGIEALSSQAVRQTATLQRRFLENKLSPFHELIGLEIDASHPAAALALAESSKARVLALLMDNARPLPSAGTAIDSEPQTAPGAPLANASALLIGKRDAAAIEYVVADRQLFAIVVTSDGTRLTVDAKTIDVSAGDLAARTERFRARVSTRDYAFAEDARSLYDLLLKPFEPALAGRTMVMVVPDGPLWGVPFAALMRGDEFVIRRMAVSYAPSLDVLARLQRGRRVGGQPTVLAVGKNDFRDSPHPDLERLDRAEDDARQLRSIYGSDRATVFVGRDATESHLRDAAPRARVIHLATHGVLDDASPMYSYLALTRTRDDQADDGRLEAWEMSRLSLNADLVVLAACETARGQIRPGEGVVGTMWALLAAGARAVVVSQYKVEEQSASRLLLDLHRAIAAGPGSRASQLRQASLAMLADPQRSHPYYWAAFIIVGDGE